MLLHEGPFIPLQCNFSTHTHTQWKSSPYKGKEHSVHVTILHTLMPVQKLYKGKRCKVYPILNSQCVSMLTNASRTPFFFVMPKKSKRFSKTLGLRIYGVVL